MSYTPELLEDAADAISDWINGAPCVDQAHARSLVNRVSTIAVASRDLNELRAENTRLRSQIDHLNRTHPDCGAQLFDLQEENAGLRARIQELTEGKE